MKKITVELLGFSDRTARILTLFLSRHSKDKYTLVDGKGMLNILDLDCVNAKKLWENCSAHEGILPAIVVSIHEKALPNTIWLKKPLDAESLTKAIDKIIADYQLKQIKLKDKEPAGQNIEFVRKLIEQEKKLIPKVDISEQRVYISKSLQGYTKNFSKVKLEENTVDLFEEGRELHSFYGSRKDESYTVNLGSTENFYLASQYLQGAYMKALKLASQENEIIQLSGGGVNFFITDKGTRTYSRTKYSLLHKISYLNTATTRVFTVNPLVNIKSFEYERNQLTEYSSDSLLWTLSLWCSRGRLPKGVSGDRVVSLEYWPNFTRLDIPPYGMKIVALWFNSPTSINKTVIKLNVPYRAVYSVFSACYALGLVNYTSDEKQIQQKAMAAKPGKKVSIPGRIFKAFFNKLN